jgi:hypothetical protein
MNSNQLKLAGFELCLPLAGFWVPGDRLINER